MHIAIEGMDGVGKSSTAKELAERLDFSFIEKPLHYILDDEGMKNYLKITAYINNNMGKEITSAFYGLGNIYTSHIAKDKSIITDRHLASNYCWNSEEDNKDYFDYLVRICGKPDYTIVLYATGEKRKSRIYNRNPNDPDLINKSFNDSHYEKMIDFLKKYHMPYYVLDNGDLSLAETIESIISHLREVGVITTLVKKDI